jgi:hypothetical protein
MKKSFVGIAFNKISQMPDVSFWKYYQGTMLTLSFPVTLKMWQASAPMM